MASQRRSEAAWIEARQRWQINVQKDGQRRTFTSSIKGRKGKHDAETKADEWLESGTVDMRFPQAWEAYTAQKSATTGKATMRNTECIYKLHLLPNIGNRKLASITPIMWQRCIDAAAAKGLTYRSCTNVRAAIVSFVRFALRSRWAIQRLEDGDLTIPKSAAPVKPKTVLQPDDIRTLFTESLVDFRSKPRQAHFIFAFRFLVLTGLRRGELCGLRNEDISGTQLTVNRSINGINVVTDGKNANARRTIELGAHAMQVLQDQRDYLASTGIVSPWVFPDRYGEHVNPPVLFHNWEIYRTKYGITSTLHELRHTFISLNKSDMPMELMKLTVGHSTAMDTFGVYGHEVEGDRHRAAQIADNVFDRILNQNVY